MEPLGIEVAGPFLQLVPGVEVVGQELVPQEGNTVPGQALALESPGPLGRSAAAQTRPLQAQEVQLGG